MSRATPHFPTLSAWVSVVIALLGLGCEGTISDPSGMAGSPSATGAGGTAPGSRGGATSSSGGLPGSPGGGSSGSSASVSGGTGSPGDPGGLAANPTLAQIATQYFPGQAATEPRKRVFRLTRTQLDRTTKTLLPKHFNATALATLPADPLQTNYEYAENLGFNPANFTPLTTWASQLASSVRAAPSDVIDCGAGDVACLREQARRFVSQAFRATLPATELTRYADFFTDSVASVGLPSATADLVEVVLTSPHYVFRDEVLTDAQGLLLPAQQLQNITYTLADAPPEALGLASTSASAYVQTPATAQQTIDQVLASAEAHEKLIRFFLAWLEVKEPADFTIASSVFPEFTPEVAEAVVSETKAFLERQLSVAVPKLRDITESNRASVPSAAAFLYGKSGTSAASPIELDPTQRLGIFTEPAVLASHSGPTTSRLVKRGVFFVRKVMCMPLGSPPQGTDTTIPANAGATERQRVETVTAQPKCTGCHALINPFGFMLENFDAIGRWRTTDENAPIDPSIDVNFLDEGELRTASPVEALRSFTRSWRFQQCFARQLFRFYAGRDETAADDPLLRQMFFDFANNDEQDILRLLRTMASAPTFSRRSETP